MTPNNRRTYKKGHRRYSRKKITILALSVAFIAFSGMRCIRQCEGGSGDEKNDSLSVENLPRLNDSINNTTTQFAQAQKLDSMVNKFLKRWEIKGAQLAVSRNDSLVYVRGYGWAEQEKQIVMEPSHIMRIASVSKLLTAVGIMKLQEMGKVKLSEHVFGPTGVLNDSAYTNIIKDKRHFDITVEDLLRHRAGFTRAEGDPMFATRYIMMQNRLTTPPDHETLLKIVLKRRLGYQPGSDTHKYSNIGYLLLSMIIEKRTGLSYEEFMQKHVLNPAGCFGFKIAGNYYKDKYPNEVKYYMHKDAEPIDEFNNSKRQVVKCYGENDVTALSGAGAWCASAAEVCHFVSAIDGDAHYPDIINAHSLDLMTKEGDYHFSLGWNTTPVDGVWSRTGTLSGTSALVLRYAKEKQCWVFMMNTSTWKGQMFAKDTREFLDELQKKFGAQMKAVSIEYVQKKASKK